MALKFFLGVNPINVPVSTGLFTLVGAIALYCTCRVLYQLYLHPLAKVPGPRLAAITWLYKFRLVTSGNFHLKVDNLHKKYGQIIRIGPNELSSTHPSALKDIYGHHASAQTFLKDPRMYSSPLGQSQSVLTTIDIGQHARMRRLLSHAFSDRALADQEAFIHEHVDKLIAQLRQQAQDGPFDIIPWFNFFTFDVIGDLSFGESFDSLSEGKFNEWIQTIHGISKALSVAWSIRSFPLLEKTYHYFLPTSIRQRGAKHFAYARTKVHKRLQSKTDRKDFISCLNRENVLDTVAEEEMTAHAASLVLAGSDTLNTGLSGVCYCLTRNPEPYEKLVNEIRSSFQDAGEITYLKAQKLPYLHAVIEEGLRLFPPAPMGPPRLAPKGGAMVGDMHVPDNTYISAPAWALTHSEVNFKDAFSFKPERWIGPSTGDLREQSQPFLLGPRACMGRNLAWMEMKLALTKLLWNFDLELINHKLVWERDQKIYLNWQKPKVVLRLIPHEKSG